ncbi:MAG TPA: hypothetical protein VGB08_06040 [Allosphingosinicella sp.]
MNRILHLLALIAMMLAPMAMHGAEAAPAPAEHHATSADAHCGGSDQAPDEGDKGRGADCALACSAMPGVGATLHAAAAHRTLYNAAPAAFFAGTAPGSDPPPPRNA